MTDQPGVDPQPSLRQRIRGCLLAGAIGDALGAPIEFLTTDQIDTLAPDGVHHYLPTRYHPDGRTGLITDDTQMTLYTVDGLIRVANAGNGATDYAVRVLHRAYRRWHDTQTGHPADPDSAGWIDTLTWLHHDRAPGATCMTALADRSRPPGSRAANTSKGCGTVMRTAPIGFLHRSRPALIDIATHAAATTHGHPTAQTAAAALTLLIARITDGDDLITALEHTFVDVALTDHNSETTTALALALALETDTPPTRTKLQTLGEGWTADEALSIAVYAALSYPHPDQIRDALAFAVNHNGDSDSTGAICGNILGALHGDQALPADLLAGLEGRDDITRIADDYATAIETGDPDDNLAARYPHR